MNERRNLHYIFYLFYSNYQFQVTDMNSPFSQRRIETIRELPIQHKDRRITDICCCCLGVIFGLLLFILALVLINKSNLARSNFPTDNEGHLCMYDNNPSGKLLPFIYFNDLSDPLHSRYCVGDCPQPGVPTQCWNGTCNLGYYPNYPLSDRVGAYCLPEDETMRNRLIETTGMNLYNDLLKAIDILLISFGISVGLSILWMLLVQYLPQIMVWVAFGLAFVLLIITAIVFLVDSHSELIRASGWAIFLALLAILIAIILIFYLIVHRRRIKYCGVFLKNAGSMLRQKIIVFLYILLFLVLTILFCILIVFEYLAFSSVAEPVVEQGSMYRKLVRNFWFMAPLVIQTLWGLSFLRDAFNFCVSGCAIQWYFNKPVQCFYPFKAFITKHFGSIAGGSFLNAFLYIPNLFIDLCCNNMDNMLCNCLDLPRGDAYPYIYMTSTTYCPAVRQVQYLCKRSRICKGNESTNTFYALAARLVIALATMLIAYWIMQRSITGSIVNPYVLLGVFFMALFVTCYFVDIHVDIAQALMVAFLAEWEVNQFGYKDMNIARESLKYAIDDLEHKDIAQDLLKQQKDIEKHKFKH